MHTMMSIITTHLLLTLIAALEAALGAVDLRHLCNEDPTVHCAFMPPQSALAYSNATLEIYPPHNFIGKDNNPNGVTGCYPKGSAGRARWTCKGDKTRSEFDIAFNDDGSSGLHSSPDNSGKGAAAFNDAPTVHPSPNELIRSSTAGVDVILSCL